MGIDLIDYCSLADMQHLLYTYILVLGAVSLAGDCSILY